MQSFILPANGAATPDSIARKRRMAEAMLAKGLETGPIGHWSQGAARMVQALTGGLAARKADEQDAALQAETKKEAMARQLLEDQWRESGRAHEWQQDALENERANRPPNPQLENLGGGQFMQYDPRDPHGSQQIFKPEGYTPQVDPMDALKLERERLEIEGLKNPVQKPTSNIQEYEYAKQQGFTGTFPEWEAAKRSNMVMQSDGQGGFTFQQGVGAKPLTEGQSKDVGFATRAEGANPILEQYEDALTGYGDTALNAVPYGLGQGLKTEDFQLAEQAGNEFLTAFLRKDSGATITPNEENLYGRIYLPRPGDGKELVAQKREARKRAIAGINAGLPAAAIAAKEMALSQSVPPQQTVQPPANRGSAAPNIESLSDEELQDIIDGN